VSNTEKALRIYRQHVGSGGSAKAFIHQIQVDRSGINVLQIFIRHDISVTFREKDINKFLIDVAYGQQDCGPIFCIYPLCVNNGIGLFSINELILIEAVVLASSKRFARSILCL